MDSWKAAGFFARFSILGCWDVRGGSLCGSSQFSSQVGSPLRMVVSME